MQAELLFDVNLQAFPRRFSRTTCTRRGSAVASRRSSIWKSIRRSGWASWRPSATERAQLLRLSVSRSEEHTSELQSLAYLVCRLLLEKKNKETNIGIFYHIEKTIQA